MELLQSFHFIRPGWLLLIPVAGWVWWWFRRSSDPLLAWRQQVEPDLLNALTEGDSRRASQAPLLIFWLITCLSIAGPTWRKLPSPFGDEAAPMIVVLKADLSMDTRQPEPSRMARAQLKIHDLAELWKGQPLGLIAYSGSSHLVFPPTKDTDVVAQMASEISPDIMPSSGDRLDLALQQAEGLLAKTGGSIVVIGDSITTPISSLGKSSHLMRVLEVNLPENAEAAATKSAARTLGATVISLTPDQSDVGSITRDAARVRANLTEETGARWQEAGYWLIPVLVVAYALSFRRSTHAVSQ